MFAGHPRRLGIALIALLSCSRFAARGGEEIMPLVGGSYSEVSAVNDVSGLQRKASDAAEPEGRAKKSTTHLTLPALKAEDREIRLRMVEVDDDSAGGHLNFTGIRPLAISKESGIPGLLSPEILAIDQYSIREEEESPEVSPEFRFEHGGGRVGTASPAPAPAAGVGKDFGTFPDVSPGFLLGNLPEDGGVNVSDPRSGMDAGVASPFSLAPEPVTGDWDGPQTITGSWDDPAGAPEAPRAEPAAPSPPLFQRIVSPPGTNPGGRLRTPGAAGGRRRYLPPDFTRPNPF